MKKASTLSARASLRRSWMTPSSPDAGPDAHEHLEAVAVEAGKGFVAHMPDFYAP
ncbi:MAG: hypothetical protein K6E40_02280 [Desulfovibrio sp.]|nr:hypothetical protein [Desulfovibrio sp.]